MSESPPTTRASVCQPVQPRAAKRIVFTGDFLRPSGGGMHPTQHENIRWIYQLLKTPLEMATGLPTEIVHWDNDWRNGSRLDRGTVEAVYRMMGLRAQIQSWPWVFSAKTLPASVEDLFLRMFCDSIVVGFELPPYLVNFLNRHKIGFVDCSLSPVRFMDDVMFEMSSNIEGITQALKTFAVGEDYIRLQAGIMSSNVAKGNPNPPMPNSLLVILQTRFDKVVIENKRFVTVMEHLDTLKSVAQDYDHVLIKEHPLEGQPQTLERLQRYLPQAQATKDNFYRLVSHKNVAGVAALSSSCVLEATYFGRKGHYLLPGFTPDTFTVGLEGVHIDDAIICPDFWRDILAGFPCPVTQKDGLRLPSKANRFRKQLRTAWSFNELDTDIAVQWAASA
ncbi:hypothetical protein AQS8620_02842 [Aquimixticola soesokkakensis]|uniref:Capsule polysaccharide biosynthesis protein n=1 Tax=Aquimixticola soesokkakensis TaxID=1519096 RepID=A0A1Y5TF31_9RHOB|nr:hypothetical protein [Aquimixticola soesokkakensis]SLN62604.1 hypothetical protein AQS8620_02842 [Aquimixticola soesokkakensis]